MRFRALVTATAALLSSTTTAIELNIQSDDSIKNAASEIAHDMMTWYIGNQTGQTPGILVPVDVYYWWLAGAMMGTLIDYWYYTGDDSYNDIVTEAILWQASDTRDFMPPNQTKTEGNDDQAFWGFTAMTAAEYKFPNPPSDQPQWLELAQGTWNSQQLRWDTGYCGGGLRWQIFPWNTGYDYKNTPSNAGFINLGARLYAYTDNETYAEWTEKVWDWLVETDLITDETNPPAWRILDGSWIRDNCTITSPIQWSYNIGMLLNAAAVMWNATGDAKWEERVNGIWSATGPFFHDQIMFEAACEKRGNCNTDQLSFKAYLSRFLAASTKWMPQLYDSVSPYLAASAQAAASQCTGTIGGLVGSACGFEWSEAPTWDGTYGFGQQMDALEVVLSQLIQGADHPVTAKKGGISKGDPSAGTGGDGTVSSVPMREITTGDKAGAGVLTAAVLVAWVGGAWWMVS
ncbi:uncharacterized protein LTR77_004739 [Saxophila tyrrhenica]|uniref:Mannan endo-1,6-alpha-mannosidase n=1 Tax=Saxophila tyrrhenica TaxID=1690608 RepID=A0AAV9PA99_9PEZI|nr:hypothetical protein LTR77_004739 [Saxophila tyrrhenica]